jgi:hypothetical protein
MEKVIKSLEEALEVIKAQNIEIVDLKNKATDSEVAAKEAIDAYNELQPKSEEVLELKVEGGKAIINFGVDFEGKYYSKKDLLKQKAIVEKLIAIGSGAVTKL